MVNHIVNKFIHYAVSKKLCHHTFAHNFEKYWSIKNFSLLIPPWQNYIYTEFIWSTTTIAVGDTAVLQEICIFVGHPENAH